jgi:hypothetical protein
MRKRTLPFPCLDNICQELAIVIQYYADAAFMLGGSECAQATRESLLSLAEQLINSDKGMNIQYRQVPLLKTAIKWYFEEVRQDPILENRLLQYLKRPKKTMC